MAGNKGFIVQPRDRHLLRELAILGWRTANRSRSLPASDRRLASTPGSSNSFAPDSCGRFFLGSGGGRKALYALSQKGAQLVGRSLPGTTAAAG